MSLLRTILLFSLFILLIPAGTLADDTYSTTSSSFRGHSDTMIISGDILVDSSITVTLSINPSEEGFAMHKDMMSEYKNKMVVSISDLIEYEDLSDDGFSDDDQILSSYSLNIDNLNEVRESTVDGNTIFSIESKENDLFKMTIEVIKSDNIPIAFKWSYDLVYPFISNSSELAIIHSLEDNTETMSNMMNNNNHMGQNHDNMMRDNHEYLPMTFSWDNTAIIDGKETEISPIINNNDFILSFPLGNNINYDPQIDLNPSDISDVDKIITKLLDQSMAFLEPQVQSIIMGMIGVTAIFITGLILERRNRINF